MWIFCYFVNLAAASRWLRRSWSPNYSVLVGFELQFKYSATLRSPFLGLLPVSSR
jgi:hypothetical protein